MSIGVKSLMKCAECQKQVFALKSLNDADKLAETVWTEIKSFMESF